MAHVEMIFHNIARRHCREEKEADQKYNKLGQAYLARLS